ncbi:hypothetical protein Desku_1013 [Desulfofundulus kuznetsovii DSM 6115]|uniref:Uncharacterized protein n=1 Tax=Desulfofundulus kuznetsovii (strain DSM 6115 / VKM B-1805 / 17) TaxID=760568 RepID=A0AAU8PP28_DESK7|nr:hypothetical protein Desku_1013 [Desulfofundulus kuznetsovii DSM 6115]
MTYRFGGDCFGRDSRSPWSPAPSAGQVGVAGLSESVNCFCCHFYRYLIEVDSKNETDIPASFPTAVSVGIAMPAGLVEMLAVASTVPGVLVTYDRCVYHVCNLMLDQLSGVALENI